MTIWKLYKKDKELMKEIWPLISDVNQDCPVKDNVVRSIFWTEVCARKAGTTLSDNPYRTFLIKKGGEFINEKIKREISIVGKGGPRIEANALIKALNKNKFRGVNKLRIME